MAITYMQYAFNRDMLAFHNINGRLCVLGFMARHGDGDFHHYAVDGRGHFYRTKHTYAGNEAYFDKANRPWLKTAAIPADAEFIGHYEDTVTSKAQEA